MRRQVLVAIATFGLAACGQQGEAPHWAAFGGDAARGRVVITQASCGACHLIPGVSGATGQVGPPLAHFAQRTIVAGMVPNTPKNLAFWIAHPQAVTPGNAMPNPGLTDQQANDAAAYLYSLR